MVGLTDDVEKLIRGSADDVEELVLGAADDVEELVLGAADDVEELVLGAADDVETTRKFGSTVDDLDGPGSLEDPELTELVTAV